MIACYCTEIYKLRYPLDDHERELAKLIDLGFLRCHIHSPVRSVATRRQGSMIITTDSHLDHSLTTKQLAHVLKLCADQTAFFIETFTLPPELGVVSCALYGPIMGDDSITDQGITLPLNWYKLTNGDAVFDRRACPIKMEMRGNRAYPSRMLVGAPLRPTNKLTVIAGPHKDYPCVLYTAFGGPVAPKEPGDPTIRPEALDPTEAEESRDFWAHHAIAVE
jgi:hypothetical protein